MFNGVVDSGANTEAETPRKQDYIFQLEYSLANHDQAALEKIKQKKNVAEKTFQINYMLELSEATRAILRQINQYETLDTDLRQYLFDKFAAMHIFSSVKLELPNLPSSLVGKIASNKQMLVTNDELSRPFQIYQPSPWSNQSAMIKIKRKIASSIIKTLTKQSDAYANYTNLLIQYDKCKANQITSGRLFQLLALTLKVFRQQLFIERFIKYQTQNWLKLNSSACSQVVVLDANDSLSGSDYIVTDLHGHSEYLAKLLMRLRAEPGSRLFIAGDFVDRGNQSLEVVELYRAAQADGLPVYGVRGNHEDMVLEVLNIFISCEENLDRDMKQEFDTLFGKWQNIVKQLAYPYDKSKFAAKSAYKHLLNECCKHAKEKNYNSKIWSIFDNLVYNGGAWVFALDDQQRRSVKQFIEQLPYMIHVKGSKTVAPYNMVHAALPAIEAIFAVAAGEREFTQEEILYMTWARPAGNDQVINQFISRATIVTYVGHNATRGNESIFVETNSINADMGTKFNYLIMLLDHTQQKIECYFKDQATLDRYYDNTLQIRSHCLNNIVANIFTVWKKLHLNHAIEPTFNIHVLDEMPINSNPPNEKRYGRRLTSYDLSIKAGALKQLRDNSVDQGEESIAAGIEQLCSLWQKNYNSKQSSLSEDDSRMNNEDTGKIPQCQEEGSGRDPDSLEGGFQSKMVFN